MTPGALSNDEARTSLERILNTPEFTQARMFQHFEDFVRHLFENYRFSGMHGSLDGLDGLDLPLRVLLVLGGLLLLIFLVRVIAPFWQVMVRDVKNEEVAERAYVRPTPEELLAEADKQALQGDFRRAVRDMYLCMLLEMDNRRLITFKAAKTNDEYLREITQKAAGVRGIFQRMVKLFEHKWYGLEQCAGEDFQKGRELYAALLKDGSHG